MASQKTFMLANGVTIEKIGEYLVDWFQGSKNMIAEGARAQGGGYFVQAKDQADGWKTISGMSKALQVQLIKADNNVIVNCDFGKWSDKIGAGAVGLLVAWPLLITAGIGAAKQSKLPEEVFSEIERFIVTGGQSVVVGAGSRLKEEEIECPKCHAKNSKEQKFCKECGERLGKICPNCGAEISDDVICCPECGAMTKKESCCIKCGQPIAKDAKYCNCCGAKQEQTCPNCGSPVANGTVFCPACGERISGKKICKQCKAEIKPGEKFCSICGTKVE